VAPRAPPTPTTEADKIVTFLVPQHSVWPAARHAAQGVGIASAEVAA